MTPLRIRFIVTGDLERAAIVPSIGRYFPDANWEGTTVEWAKPRKVHGATTHRLVADRAPSGPMRALARAVLYERLFGHDGYPADLVIAVDDLELHNFDQPDVVCGHFCAAMNEEIAAGEHSASKEERIRESVREGCSFHLISPMVESYVFGDHDALVAAGCASEVEPVLVHPDVERFESADEQWRDEWGETNARMQSQMPWWREERHAKHYLEHLVNRNGAIYDEVVNGSVAFGGLMWPGVPHDHSAVAFARALFEDLAAWFGTPNPLGDGVPSRLTWPAREIDRRALILRNM